MRLNYPLYGKTTDLIVFQEKARHIGEYTERLGKKIGKDRPFLPLEDLGPTADLGWVFPQCFRMWRSFLR